MIITEPLTLTLSKDEVTDMLCKGIVNRLRANGIEIDVAKGHVVDAAGGTLEAVVTLTPDKDEVTT